MTTTTYNLTTANTQLVDTNNVLDGALFVTATQSPTGTGVYDTFLTIQATPTEDGFNTDYRPAPLDDGSSPFTHSITLADIPIITTNGQQYYAFRLDINEPNNSTAPISLTGLKIYSAGVDNGSVATLSDLAALNPIYDLDASSDVTINLTDLNAGSGQGDLFFYVPVEKFAGVGAAENIYFYSAFSSANAGFEEWSLVGNTQGGGGGEPTAQLGIDKLTNGLDDGGTILIGETVTWTYVVNNLGDGAVSNVVVTDDNGTPDDATDDFTATYVSGDTNGDHAIDNGETWTFTATGLATKGPYTNTGTANGTGPVNGVPTSLTANDLSGYFGADPKIAIDKVTVDGAASGDHLTILAGEAISWQYTVTNAGNVALSNVSVSDSVDGVTAVYVSGDTNSDGKLDLDETWIFAASGVATIGNYSNIGTATGSFTDTGGHTATPDATDGSGYFGADPEISINKITISGDQSGDGITALVGAAVTWQYTVTNTGNEALSGVTVTDSVGGVNPLYVGGDTNGNGKLDLTEAWIYTASGTVVSGAYSNVGTASGSFTDDAGHVGTDTSTDSSSYTGLALGHSGLTQGFWANHSAAWDGKSDVTWGNIVDKAGGLWGDAFTASTVAVTAQGNKYAGNDDILYGLTGHGAGNIQGDVMLGDANGNGVADTGEATMLLANSTALADLTASATGKSQTIMLDQLVAAQLNVYNGDPDPGSYHLGDLAYPGHDLIGEAVLWLNGLLPGETGMNANTNKTSDGAWNNKFFDTGISVSGHGEIMVSGQDIKNVLQAFNQDNIVTAANDSLIGWSTDGGVHVLGVHANTPDNFWLVAYEHGVITG